MANWTDEETFKLIEIWSRDAVQAVLESSRRNREIYSSIAREMEEAGYMKSADQCSRKMKKLRFEYRKGRLRGKHGKTGERKNWKFFDAMDLVLGHKPLTHPPVIAEANDLHILTFSDPRELQVEDEAALGEEVVERNFEGNLINFQNGEVSRHCSEGPTEAMVPVEGRSRKRRRESEDINNMVEFLLDKMMKMQERTQKDTQEFQLRLMSVICHSRLPTIPYPSLDLGPSYNNRNMAMQVVRSVGRLAAPSSYFFLCDMQEKFRPTIKYYSEIITVASKMVQVANILDIPVVVTEQYPKALGPTVSEIDISKVKGVFDKTKFSMITEDVMGILEEEEETRKSVVLFGIEAQVCVQQTALDLVAKGYDVHVVADAVSSRTMVDRLFALERMRQSGVFVSTSESVIFELMSNSKHPKFKEIQTFIKNSAPDSGLLTKL